MTAYKPLDSEETNELIKRSKNGDSEATDVLVNGNFPLIKAIVKSYLNKGVEYDDLYQIGCVGFLKAIKNFNPKFDVKFSTYAVPMIAGEIKRFLRDDGMIKVSRSIKTLAIKLKAFIENKKQHGGESPTIEELAKEFCVDQEDVVIALDSYQQTISINAKVDEDYYYIGTVPEKSNYANELMYLKGKILLKLDKNDEYIDYFGLKKMQV